MQSIHRQQTSFSFLFTSLIFKGCLSFLIRLHNWLTGLRHKQLFAGCMQMLAYFWDKKDHMCMCMRLEGVWLAHFGQLCCGTSPLQENWVCPRDVPSWPNYKGSNWSIRRRWASQCSQTSLFIWGSLFNYTTWNDEEPSHKHAEVRDRISYGVLVCNPLNPFLFSYQMIDVNANL